MRTVVTLIALLGACTIAQQSAGDSEIVDQGQVGSAVEQSGAANADDETRGIATSPNFVGTGKPGSPLELASGVVIPGTGGNGALRIGSDGGGQLACRYIQVTDELQVLGATSTPRDAWFGVSHDVVDAPGVTVGAAAGPGVTTYSIETTNTARGAVSVVAIDQRELPFDGSIAFFTAKGAGVTFRITDGGAQSGSAWPFTFGGASLNSGGHVDIGNVDGAYSGAMFMFDQNGARSGTGVSSWMLMSVGMRF
jgi:hypothetical protein